jgi:hypothetical protein
MMIGGLNVTSFIPGRLRLKVEEIKRSDEFRQRLGKMLTRVPGIERVEVTASTGSLLVHYDAKIVARGTGRHALTLAIRELFPSADLVELQKWLDRAS